VIVYHAEAPQKVQNITKTQAINTQEETHRTHAIFTGQILIHRHANTQIYSFKVY